MSDIIRTTLGPRSMLKMLLDANGGIVLTNDGHAILREIDVSHPAAKVSCVYAGLRPTCTCGRRTAQQGRGGLCDTRQCPLGARCRRTRCVPLQSMIQLSRTQDEEVGDGTTSVIILGEPGLASIGGGLVCAGQSRLHVHAVAGK